MARLYRRRPDRLLPDEHGLVPDVHRYPLLYGEGYQDAQIALTMGIIGLFFCSLLFGIIAVCCGNRARALGHDATIAIALGWFDIVVWVAAFVICCACWFLAVILLFGLFAIPFLFLAGVLAGVG